jgi:hypothetical protein
VAADTRPVRLIPLLPHDSDEQWVAFLMEARMLDRNRYRDANRELIERYNRGEAGGGVHRVLPVDADRILAEDLAALRRLHRRADPPRIGDARERW